REITASPGLPVLGILLLVFLGCVAGTIAMAGSPLMAITIIVGILAFIALFGLFIVNPNEAKVLQLFGHYVGTVREQGLKWANPFYTKRKISLRIRNFESSKLKVNDHDGSPIDIAAVV